MCPQQESTLDLNEKSITATNILDDSTLEFNLKVRIRSKYLVTGVIPAKAVDSEQGYLSAKRYSITSLV